MKYFAAAATLIAAVQAAAIGNTNFDSVAAGQTFTITWYDASGPVSLDLRNGASGDLKQLATLTSGASSTNGAGSYTWTVPATLDGAGPYAFVITDSTGVNYSVQFPISGINVDAPASKTATTTAAQTTPTADITTVQSKTATSVAAEAVTTTGTVTSVTMVQVPPTTSHTVEFQSSSSLIPHSSSKVPSTMSTQVSTSGAVSAPTSAPTSVPTSVPEQGKAVGMASPFALIFVSVAAMFYLQ